MCVREDVEIVAFGVHVCRLHEVYGFGLEIAFLIDCGMLAWKIPRA